MGSPRCGWCADLLAEPGIATTNLQRRTEPALSGVLTSTGAPRNPAGDGTHQGNPEERFGPLGGLLNPDPCAATPPLWYNSGKLR